MRVEYLIAGLLAILLIGIFYVANKQSEESTAFDIMTEGCDVIGEMLDTNDGVNIRRTIYNCDGFIRIK